MLMYQQRLEHKRRVDGHTNSALNDERLEQLESIGFSWANPKGEAGWEAKFVSLCTREGNVNVMFVVV